TVQYSDFNHAPINNQAVVYSDSIVSDSVNWVPIRGYFIADSAYKYIMITDFFTDSNTDTVGLNPQIDFNWSYYYIDAVYTSTDSMCCYTANSSFYNNEQILLFPNPSNSILNIKSPLESSEVRIYNLMGQEILKLNKNEKEISIDISVFPDGFYFLVEQSENKFYCKKFLLQK
ncbi:MAG: T9SS type A sorting domain-containing protein, partial [Bacteroidota bacterium]